MDNPSMEFITKLEKFSEWAVMVSPNKKNFHSQLSGKLKKLVDNMPGRCDAVILNSFKTFLDKLDQITPSTWNVYLKELGELLESVAKTLQNPEKNDKTKDKKETQNTGLPANVDNDIFEQFLIKLGGTLEDLEKWVLQYEKKPDQEVLQSLRAILHNLKGEAGVVGIYDLEKICHIIEGHLNEKNVSPDFLLVSIDWIARKKENLEGSKNPLLNLDELADLSRADGDEKTISKIKKFERLRLDTCGDIGLLQEFIMEAREHLQNADSHLLKLEKNFGLKDSLDAVFRSYHTIKGVADFLNLQPVAQLCHVVESYLSNFRENKREINELPINFFFEANDKLSLELDLLKKGLSENGIYKAHHELPGFIENIQNILFHEPVCHKNKEMNCTISERTIPDNIIAEKIQVKEVVKVDMDKIDKLIEIIGELVIAESMVLGNTHVSTSAPLELKKNLAQLNKITKTLQEVGMSMRLVSIQSTFQKMERVVRDISKKSGKAMTLITSGNEIELDKNIIEHLGDPLIHMVRNSADHGIECTEERVNRGKDAEGKIYLRAYQESGNIVIEIEDDGRGLDLKAITQKALKQKLIPENHSLSPEDICNLIFSPGLSTAREVTNISGRGVGMDVVKKNIEMVRGHIDVINKEGAGCKFILKLPLTLAIMDGLVVGVGKEKFIIPTLSVVESFKLSNVIKNSLLNGSEMIRYRNNMIPVFSLGQLLDVKPYSNLNDEPIVVVVEDAKKQLALIVDSLIGQQQTVIKNLGSSFGEIGGLAGAAIMSDGNMMLIIDIPSLLKGVIGQNGKINDGAKSYG